jgi:hypothetical protein
MVANPAQRGDRPFELAGQSWIYGPQCHWQTYFAVILMPIAVTTTLTTNRDMNA